MKLLWKYKYTHCMLLYRTLRWTFIINIKHLTLVELTLLVSSEIKTDKRRNPGHFNFCFLFFFFICYILLVNTSLNWPVQQSLKKGNQHNSKLHFWFLLRLSSVTQLDKKIVWLWVQHGGITKMMSKSVECTMKSIKKMFFPLPNSLWAENLISMRLYC